MNKNEYLNNFYKHISTDSILVVTSKGELIRLYCPFKVKSLVSFPGIPEGSICQVVRVQITPELKDIFIIGDKAYFTQHFQIIHEGGIHPSTYPIKSFGWINYSIHQTPEQIHLKCLYNMAYGVIGIRRV